MKMSASPECEDSQKTSSEGSKIDLSELEHVVDELYALRDNYIQRFGVEAAVKKWEDVQCQQKSVLSTLADQESHVSSDQGDRSKLCLLKGLSLNVMPDFNKEALEVLNKAVKLNPDYATAWNTLGDVYWKQMDYDSARSCLEQCLKLEPKNKTALRSLSMVSRQLLYRTRNPAEQSALLEKSMQLAKEAVSVDPKDGNSWACLGMAYFTTFLHVGSDVKLLELSLKSCKTAREDPTTANDSSQLLNYGIVLKYCQHYVESLENLDKSIALADDTTIDMCRLERGNLAKFLIKVDDLVRHKGKMRAKKLTAMAADIRPSMLGPYSKLVEDTSSTDHVVVTPFAKLTTGVENTGAVLLGRVVCTVPDDMVPFTFCMVDGAGDCLSVMVYNIKSGAGVKIGDTVAVFRPLLRHVQLVVDTVNIDFRFVRVQHYVSLVVNGRRVAQSQQASPALTITALKS